MKATCALLFCLAFAVRGGAQSSACNKGDIPDDAQCQLKAEWLDPKGVERCLTALSLYTTYARSEKDPVESPEAAQKEAVQVLSEGLTAPVGELYQQAQKNPEFLEWLVGATQLDPDKLDRKDLKTEVENLIGCIYASKGRIKALGEVDQLYSDQPLLATYKLLAAYPEDCNAKDPKGAAISYEQALQILRTQYKADSKALFKIVSARVEGQQSE